MISQRIPFARTTVPAGRVVMASLYAVVLSIVVSFVGAAWPCEYYSILFVPVANLVGNISADSF